LLLGLAAALALSGCGFYKKMQANKKNEEIQEKVTQIHPTGQPFPCPGFSTAPADLWKRATVRLPSGNYDQALQAGMKRFPSDQINRLPQPNRWIEQKKSSLVDLTSRIGHHGSVNSWAPMKPS